MSQIEKLVERFLSIPNDLTYTELVRVLSYFGYKEFNRGNTSGSAVRFVDENKNIINMHKPHPQKIVKRCAIKYAIAKLREDGKL